MGFRYGSAVGTMVKWRNKYRELVDPTTVTLLFIKADGTTATYTYGDLVVLRADTGIYYAEVPGDVVGLWDFRWEATGVVQGAQDGQFVVESSVFYPAA